MFHAQACTLWAAVAMSFTFSQCTALIATVLVNDDEASLGLRFDGVGAITSNGETRFIVDYPEPMRSSILDFLFTPGVGMALQILKVELGSDAQSTLGTEAAHIHNRGEPPACSRGVQWWFAAQARLRNPDIVLVALEWSAPGWVGLNASDPASGPNFFSQDNIDYIVSWLDCGRTQWNISDVNYLGIWNEPEVVSIPPVYLLALRAALDGAGFEAVRILPGDTDVGASVSSTLVDDLLANTSLRAAVFGVGYHHPCGSQPPGGETLIDLGLPAWSSEDYSLVGDSAGQACFGNTPARNWLAGNATATIAWGAAFSALPNALCQKKGFLYAVQPWSGGAWSAQPSAWAMATWTWFTAPGWTWTKQGHGSDFIPPSANSTSIVTTLLSPLSSSLTGSPVRDFTMVLSTQSCTETCFTAVNGSEGTLQVLLAGGPLAGVMARGGTVQVWVTNSSAGLVPLVPISVTGAAFALPFQPESLYVITSLPRPEGASGGFTPVIPHGIPDVFPMPWTQDFDGVEAESYGPYFADWDGSFQVVQDPFPGFKVHSRPNMVLRALALQPPVRWHCTDVDPITMTAPGYANVDVAVSVRIDEQATTAGRGAEDIPYAGVAIRVNKPFSGWCPIATGYALSIFGNGTWALTIWPGNASPAVPLPVTGLVLASGVLQGAAVGQWHRLEIAAFGTTLTVSIDGVQMDDVTDAVFAHGTVALISSWHFSSFDGFSLSQVGPSTPSNSALWAQYMDDGLTNSFTGLVGLVLIPTQDVSLAYISRFAGHGARGVHELLVVRASDNATLASTWLNLSASVYSVDPAGFSGSTLPPGGVPLSAGVMYYIVSSETAGGDPHYHLGSPSACAGDNTVRSPVVALRPSTAPLLTIAGSVYMSAVPVPGSAPGEWVQLGEGEPRSLGPVGFGLVM